MTTQTSFPFTDLVLRVSGGKRDGELIPVKTQKCFVGIQENADGIKQLPQFAIFRGPHGAAVRSYADEITVNGASASVHWLKEGDRIEFPNTMAVEVTQLGSVDQPCRDLTPVEQEAVAEESFCQETIQEAEEPRSLESDQHVESETQETFAELNRFDAASMVDHKDSATESRSNECETDGPKCCHSQDETLLTWDASNEERSICETIEFAANVEAHEIESFEELDAPSSPNSSSQFSQRLELVASQIREIQGQNELSSANFEKLNQRLDDLCRQMSRMDSLANSGEIANVRLESAVETTHITDDEPAETFIPYGEGREGLDSTTSDHSDVSEDNVTANYEITPDPIPRGEYDLASELYSYAEDNSDDERIVTFDPEMTDSTETIEPTDQVEITDEPSELNGVSQSEIDSRLAEMERVFGGSMSEAESSAELTLPDYENSSSPTLPREISPTQLFDPELETEMNISNETGNDHLMANAADDQPAHSFENLTHSQNEGVASFAANPTTDVEESFATDPLNQHLVDEVSEPGSLASQLMEDVESNLQAALEESPAEPVSPQPTEEPNVEPPKNESVADLLARMQSEGQWSGIPDDEQGIQPVDPVAVQPEPAMEQPLSEGNSEDDVEDYMSQLLSRMRGGAPASQPKPVAQPKKSKEVEQTEEVVITPPANPLKAEEFVPQRKATKIQSFEAMRELANSSARSAVMQSEEGRRKALGYVQVGIAVASFLMSVYYLVIASKGLFDISFFIGLICLSISGFLGYRFYMTSKDNELFESMNIFNKAKPAKTADEPNEETKPQP